MSFFSVNNANTVNTLFSGLNSGSGFGMSSSSGTGNFLADYASIRGGSYFKLLKTYYGSDSTASARVSQVAEKSKTKTTTSIAKDDTKTLSKIEKNAENLKSSADSLMTKGTKNVFVKKDIKQEDGTVKYDYDRDAIYSKVQSFVDNYNSLLDSAEDTNTQAIERNLEQMVKLTETNEKSLEKIGITVDEDNKLSIDKETFMKADMNTAKGLFNGAGSYAYSVSSKASLIDYQAQREAGKANLYGNNGSYSYNYSYGSNYSSYI